MEKLSIARHTGGGGERTSRERRENTKISFLEIFLKIKVFCIRCK